MNVEKELRDLKPHTKVVTLDKGQSLCNGCKDDDDEMCGLYFIEHGIMRVERDSTLTTTRASRSLKKKKNPLSLIYATPRIDSSTSLSDLRTRTPTIGLESRLLKQAKSVRGQQNVRLARIGPGFVVGSLGGDHVLQGNHCAVTSCRLHLLSYRSIEEIEKNKPRLALELFKMMTQLEAVRHTATINHLASLHNIMVSLAPSKPVDRLKRGAIEEAAKKFGLYE
mmetsp:Transcript_823/g.994  ORF Transcript_823/g.994 Transcript_823/m.994 type:complete len:224 (+) Transcript_823:1384-2055(+)